MREDELRVDEFNRLKHYAGFIENNEVDDKLNNVLEALRASFPALEFEFDIVCAKPNLITLNTILNGRYIMLKTNDSKKQKELIRENMNIQATDTILEFGDKYNNTLNTNLTPPIVAILPGTNLLRQVVDKDKLIQCVCVGGLLKPHPMTDLGALNHLKSLFVGKVIPKLYSGIDLVKNSRTVYTTGCSELSLYAMYLEKGIVDISFKGYTGGAYSDIFEVLLEEPNLNKRKQKLVNIINNSECGIFRIDDLPAITNYINKNF